MTPKRKAYHPQRTFDDALMALSELYVKQGWTYLSPELLTKAALEQRHERAAVDALAALYFETREAFARAQHQRHATYQAALAAARGANRNEPATLKMLEPFRRKSTRRARTNAPV